MLNNWTTYFFGSEDTNETSSSHSPLILSTSSSIPQPQPIETRTAPNWTRHSDEESDEDGWVLVGGGNNAANLGSMNDVPPRPYTNSTAGNSQVDEEEVVEEPEERHPVHLSRTARRLTTPFSCTGVTTVQQLKAIRSAQKAEKREMDMALSGKAIERANRAIKTASDGKKAHRRRQTFR